MNNHSISRTTFRDDARVDFLRVFQALAQFADLLQIIGNIIKA